TTSRSETATLSRPGKIPNKRNEASPQETDNDPNDDLSERRHHILLLLNSSGSGRRMARMAKTAYRPEEGGANIPLPIEHRTPQGRMSGPQMPIAPRRQRATSRRIDRGDAKQKESGGIRRQSRRRHSPIANVPLSWRLNFLQHAVVLCDHYDVGH